MFSYPLYNDPRVLTFYDNINLQRILDYDQISSLTTSTAKTLVIGSNNNVFVDSLKKNFSEITVLQEIGGLIDQTEKFSSIIFSDFYFMNILDSENQREILNMLLERLETNGEIVFNLELFKGDKFLDDPSVNSFVGQIEINGEIFMLFNRQEYDYFSQILYQNCTLEILNLSGELTNTLKFEQELRYTFLAEIKHLFELCGLEIKQIYSNFDKSQLLESSDEAVFILRK